MFAVAITALYGVAPPLLVVSAVPPRLPAVWSHARKLIPRSAVAVKCVLTTNRTRVSASAASSRAAGSEGVPKSVQLVPLVAYSQWPLELLADVTAIPRKSPDSTSLTFPEINAETSVPVSLGSPSMIGFRLFAPDRTGAWFTVNVI